VFRFQGTIKAISQKNRVKSEDEKEGKELRKEVPEIDKAIR